MNHRQIFILCLYIIIFWICLPVSLVLASIHLDRAFELERMTSQPWITLGILILAISVPLLILSVVQFKRFSKKFPVSADPSKVLIQTGLFAIWRHPIYLFYTLMFYGWAMLWGSRGMMLIVLPAFILLEVLYVFAEEKILRKRFGNPYSHYARKTNVIIPTFYQLLKLPLYLFFKALSSYKVLGRDLSPASGPFFVVSSHRNYLDPLYLGVAIPFPIRYITTFEMYRSPKTRWFFKAMNCIPKKRFLNDVQTGRMILKALGQDDVIGIFPEGERSWTGAMNTLKPETLNLFRKFIHIPILPVKLKGNFYTWPRWGKGLRRAKIIVEMQAPIKVNPDWTLEDLEKKLHAAIDPKDLDNPEFYCRSKNLAKDIAKVVYRCPVCQCFNSIQVIGKNKCSCRNCGMILLVDSKYNCHITAREKKTICSLPEVYEEIKIAPPDIRAMQAGSFPDNYKKFISGNEFLVAIGEDCELYQEFPPRMELLLNGQMILTNQRIIFDPEDKARFLQYKNIGSVTIESNHKVQLYDIAQRKLYQVIFPRESALKWQDFITMAMWKELGSYPNTR